MVVAYVLLDYIVNLVDEFLVEFAQVLKVVGIGFFLVEDFL